MMIKTKITTILLVFFILSLSSSALAFEEYNIVIYKDDACVSCRAVMERVILILDKFDNYNLTLKDYGVGSIEEIKEKIGFIPQPNLPIIIINKEQVLDANSYEKLYDVLQGRQIEGNKVRAMSIGLIIVAGFIDGINPCALAMLILFITALNLKLNKIKVGLSYILGTFVAYYGLGLGILKLSYTINISTAFNRGLTYVVFLLCLYVAFTHFKDFYYLNKGIFNKTTTQLKGEQKKKVQDFIKDKALKYKSMPWFFFVGFVVAIFEFACTGQTYVPILLYIASNDLNFVMLLTLYNIMFVMPLLIVLGLSLKFDTFSLSMGIHNNQKYFKLAISILFLVLALVSIIK